MKKSVMKKILFVCALAAAAAGLAACTDLSYEEFDNESDGGAAGTAVSAELPSPESDTDSADTPAVTTAEQQQIPAPQVTELTDPVESVPDAASETMPAETEPAVTEPHGGGDITSIDELIPDDEPQNTDPRYTAFKEIIDEYHLRYDNAPEGSGEFCRYYIADIDGDGCAELICETGTFQADRNASVYSFDGERIVPMGDFITWHAELAEFAGRIYSRTFAMGSSILYEVNVSEEGTVVTERAPEQPNESSIDPAPLPYYSYGDPSGLEQASGGQPDVWFNIYG